MSTKHNPPRLWWEREDLFYRKGRLFLGSRDLLEFAQSAETPVYLYNSARIKENLTRLTQSLEKREIRFKILERCNWFLDRCPGIDALDIGGGLGIPVIEGQKPLDIDRWASVIGKHAKKRDLEIILEPGDYLVIPRGTIYKLEWETTENRLLFIESHGPVLTPRRYRNDFGQLLEHSTFCERDIKRPET